MRSTANKFTADHRSRCLKNRIFDRSPRSITEQLIAILLKTRQPPYKTFILQAALQEPDSRPASDGIISALPDDKCFNVYDTPLGPSYTMKNHPRNMQGKPRPIALFRYSEDLVSPDLPVFDTKFLEPLNLVEFPVKSRRLISSVTAATAWRRHHR